MSLRDEPNILLNEILTTSRALVELGDDGSGDAPLRICQELRSRRRVLLDRLRAMTETPVIVPEPDPFKTPESATRIRASVPQATIRRRRTGT